MAASSFATSVLYHYHCVYTAAAVPLPFPSAPRDLAVVMIAAFSCPPPLFFFPRFNLASSHSALGARSFSPRQTVVHLPLGAP